jgi:hypothetical protein
MTFSLKLLHPPVYAQGMLGIACLLFLTACIAAAVTARKGPVFGSSGRLAPHSSVSGGAWVYGQDFKPNHPWFGEFVCLMSTLGCIIELEVHYLCQPHHPACKPNPFVEA